MQLQLFAEPQDPEDNPEPTGNEDKEKDEEVTFSEEQQAKIDELIKQSKLKGKSEQEKAMQKMIDELNEKIENAGKSETEKAEAEKQKQLDKLTQLEKETEQKDITIAALTKGVPSDKVNKFVKLAALSEADEIEDKVAEVLKEFPEFIPKEEEEKPAWPNATKKGDYKGKSNNNEPQNLHDAVLQALNKK